jgi:uncharacterized glyoxalase superfamily protein PhnB
MLLAGIDDVPSTRPSSQVKEHLLTQTHHQTSHLTGGFRLSDPVPNRRPGAADLQECQSGAVHAAGFILYVTDQGPAWAFYRAVLGAEPTLDVAGHDRVRRGRCHAGTDAPDRHRNAARGRIRAGNGQQCELYLRRPDAEAALERAIVAGGGLLDGMRDRPWGEQVGYVFDPDGHVLALAIPSAGH